MTEKELHNEYRKSDCKTFTDFLINKIKELETQVEKMKCCGNCDNTWNGMKLDICTDCKDHNKWEIKEND